MKKGPFKMKGSPMQRNFGKELKGTTVFGKEVSEIKKAAKTGVSQFAKGVKKVAKEIFMPVSQQVKRNDKRRLENFEKSMRSRMTQSQKNAYNKKYPNDQIK